MPELPEVENVKLKLLSVVNQTIDKIICSKFNLRKINKKEISNIKQEKILSLNRRNKYLIFETDNYWLLSHLGMTGQYYWLNDKQELKHTHLKIYLNHNHILAYADPRRFGLFYVYKKNNYNNYQLIPELIDLGIEPLDEKFNFQIFKKIVKNNQQNIKAFLLDQSNVCGIGNIYANEIMFVSKISPHKKVDQLNNQELKLLFLNIKKIIKQAVDLGGSSISDFINVNGEVGRMQNYHLVYGRKNQYCKICNNKIIAFKQNGRSTFYCSKCQK